MSKVAVVLSGSGVFDGTEIHEAVSVLIHLSRADVEYACFAPDMPQQQVINHLTGQPTDEQRNVLVESARIARGQIAALTELHEADYDAVFFPGGFGAAKNLSSFASDGADCAVHPEVERVIKQFHQAGKPIGMCCIAPVLVARTLGRNAGGPGVSVTIGDDDATASAIEAMGSSNTVKPANEAHVDTANHLATAPAYMCDAAIDQVYEGIGQMVDRTLAMIGAPTGA